jgi:hypothetical protein
MRSHRVNPESLVKVGLTGTVFFKKQFELYHHVYLVTSAVLFSIVIFFSDAYAAQPTDTSSAVPFGTSISQCTAHVLSLIKSAEHPSPDEVKQSVDICYTIMNREGQVSEFNVRSQAYLQQYSSNIVLLWMVVAITISGVFLAGLQLLASYRLATLTGSNLSEPDELTLARNQIVLKSSVTGLSIMLLSFAFFLVFVRYVYKIEEPNTPHIGFGTIDSPAVAKQKN